MQSFFMRAYVPILGLSRRTWRPRNAPNEPHVEVMMFAPTEARDEWIVVSGGLSRVEIAGKKVEIACVLPGREAEEVVAGVVLAMSSASRALVAANKPLARGLRIEGKVPFVVAGASTRPWAKEIAALLDLEVIELQRVTSARTA